MIGVLVPWAKLIPAPVAAAAALAPRAAAGAAAPGVAAAAGCCRLRRRIRSCTPPGSKARCISNRG